MNGQPLCEIARSDAKDVEAALDAAHAAKDAWGRTSAAERALILNRIADRMEEILDILALAETWDLKAFSRMDGAFLGSIDISIEKTKTARPFNMPSKDLGELAQPGKPL